eukprot:m.54567 g.54567  ORF g.54567 m.54567 type:complete len:262 (+) comp10935_c0_seq2:105-890(+)
MKIDGSVFLVTGGASGLGEGAARHLIAKGANVVILDMAAKRAKRLVEELGKQSAFVEMDATDEESIEAAINQAASCFGRIDGVVNCAGTGLGMTTINKEGEPHDMDSFEFIIRLNLIGTFSVAAKCAAHMAKNTPNEEGERGIIINVASVAAQDGQNGQAAYSASKAGVVGMALPMARDLGSRGIRVNTICPGIFDTRLTAGFKTSGGKRVADNLRKAQVFPPHRFGDPSDFGHTVVYLVENVMMNAEYIRLDGGIRMGKL